MRGELRTMTLVWVAISLVVIGGNPYRCDADGDTLQHSAAGSTSITPPSPLPPVVVTATRSETPLQQIPANVTVFSQEDIEHSPALALDDFLRQIPGFNTFRRSSSLVTAPAQDPEAQGVTLRGIGPGGASRALVLVDGIPVNDAFGGWLYWGEMPLSTIEQIEVARGGSSHLWGNFALGGVINVKTRMPETREIESRVSGGNRGTTTATLAYGDVIGPLRIRVEGNFFHTDGWHIVIPRQRGPIDQRSSSEHKHLAGCVEYSLAANCSLFLRGAFYDESRNTGTPLRIGQASRGFIAGGGTLRTVDGSHWQLSLFSHLSRFREHFSRVSEDRSSERPSQHQVVPSVDVGGSLTWARELFAQHLLTAGVDFRLINGTSRDVFFEDTGRVSDRQKSTGKQQFVGFFAQSVYNPIESLQLAFGVRLDHYENFAGQQSSRRDGFDIPTTVHFPSQDKTVFSPRLNISYQWWPGLTIRGAGYQAFRAPTLSELYRPSSIEGLALRENPRLRPEFLEGGEVGMDYLSAHGGELRVTAYWNYLRKPIANVTTAHDAVTGEDSERTRVNLGLARIRGIEVDFAYPLTTSWSLFGGYLYSEAQVVDNPRDRDLEGKRLTQVPWYGGSLGVRYTHPSQFTLIVQGRYEGKKFEDADNHDTLGGYYLIDLFMAWPFAPSRLLPQLQRGELFFAIQNLLDRDYIVDRGGGILKLGTPLLVQGGVSFVF